MPSCFEDEAGAYTDGVLDRLRETQALVLAIWPLEMANVFLIAERRDRLNEAQTAFPRIHLLDGRQMAWSPA
jgi:hypothetical protein